MTHAEAIQRVESFSELKAGWDSYRGRPISAKCIQMAKAILFRLGDGWQPIPCSDGTICLEFSQDGLNVNIDIDESD